MEGGSVLSIRAKYVSKKISKIRWRPTNQLIVEQPNILVTGSWDEEDSINSLDVWTIDPSVFFNETSQLKEDFDLGDNFDVPLHLHSLPHSGDVTDLLFLNEERILASSSSGDVTLLRLDDASQRLSESNTWGGLHHFPTGSASPCTTIASRNEGVFVSVGEDGRLNIVNLESRGPESVSTIENADSTTLTDVCFLRQQEIATVNTISQFKIWDLRQSIRNPARVLVLNVVSGSPVALRCLDQHPTQPHIVATGGQNGDLYIWDMRQDKAPATLVTCHQSDVWEVRFHPTLPNSLFTCSNDGSVFLWGNSQNKPDIFGQSLAFASNSGLNSTPTSSVMRSSSRPKGRPGLNETSAAEHNMSSWLMDDVTSRDRLAVKDLLPGHDMPINSLDIMGSTLICGTDGEEILLMQNLDVF